MYLNYEVEIPNVPGRINQVKKGNAVYVRYVVGWTYHPEKKYNVPSQRFIRKRSENDPEKMIPNENYMKYFEDLEQPEEGESKGGRKYGKIESLPGYFGDQSLASKGCA